MYYPAFLNKDRQLELMKSHVMSHDTRAGEVLESTQYGFSYMVYAKFYEGNSKISGNKILNGEHYRGCLYAIPQDIITAPTTPDVSLV